MIFLEGVIPNGFKINFTKKSQSLVAFSSVCTLGMVKVIFDPS